MEVLRSSNSTKPPTKPAAGNCSRNHKSNTKQEGNRDVDQVSHVDYVTTNANSSQSESQLYIFEDNEAVIEMIKGGSPTMRHVSKTRVGLRTKALRWRQSCELRLIGRSTESIWTPKIQIKYVDTKNQLADMPTKENFTRDEWDQLLHLLNIMNLSMFSCSHFLSNRKQSVVSKRAQERTSEKSAVAKPRPMNLVSSTLLCAKKNPPQHSSDSNTPKNQELG